MRNQTIPISLQNFNDIYSRMIFKVRKFYQKNHYNNNLFKSYYNLLKQFNKNEFKKRKKLVNFLNRN